MGVNATCPAADNGMVRGMTLPREFHYLEYLVAETEYAEVQAHVAWEAAGSLFLASDNTFDDYLAAYRLYLAACLDADILHVKFDHIVRDYESGDSLLVRQEIDNHARRMTKLYWMRRAGVKNWQD
jgi:hypothetical protein